MNIPMVNAKVIKKKRNSIVFSDSLKWFKLKVPGPVMVPPDLK